MKVKVTRKKSGCSQLNAAPGSTALKLAQSARYQRFVNAKPSRHYVVPRHTRRGA